ncbi:DegT/DnrJ/EryC1/StrS family aminotransferase [Paenibacillus sp. GCM10027626]|uniref:DegT/DnrJ/EryC1/StrS family aminotransferase n=1 Tax=Paenibacillus sp. GCM10027626 TaxID=3273411 RepID=UPI0036273DC5
MEKLAIEGGVPARKAPLPPNYPGAMVMGEEEAAKVAEVIYGRSPFRYYGPDCQNAVQTFENKMAAQLGVPYTLAVSSCTAALIVAMKALGIGYGDKVIVPANTFLATAGAVVACNAVPVFADVDESLNIDPADLLRVFDDEVKAIIVVPILGNPVDMEPVMAFAKKHGVYVIEDVAQSCGTMYKGSYAGTIGDVGVYSFQMNKVLTSGEGGAVVTRDPRIFERAVRYHDQGIFREKARYGIDSSEEEAAFMGQNYRMSELAGAVMVQQWDKLPGIVSAMKSHNQTIRTALSAAFPQINYRRCSDPEGDIGSNLGMIMASREDAMALTHALVAENINVQLLYGGKPVYMIPQLFHQRTADASGFPFNYPFRNPVVYEEQMCPRAVDLIARTVYLPISPLLTEQDVAEIIDGIIKVGHKTGLFDK